MRNPHYEYLGRRMREYHRMQQWRLQMAVCSSRTPYWNMGPGKVCRIGMTGFILNGRRIIVCGITPTHLWGGYFFHGLGRGG